MAKARAEKDVKTPSRRTTEPNHAVNGVANCRETRKDGSRRLKSEISRTAKSMEYAFDGIVKNKYAKRSRQTRSLDLSKPRRESTEEKGATDTVNEMLD